VRVGLPWTGGTRPYRQNAGSSLRAIKLHFVRRSIFPRHHDREARRAVVRRSAHGLEPDQGRRAVAVVVADVDAERASMACPERLRYAGSMTNRRRKLVLALLAAFLMAGGAVWACRQALAPPSHRINPESFEQIQGGMTPAEVEAIIGVPPGDYSTATEVFDPPCPVQHVTYVTESQLGSTVVIEEGVPGPNEAKWISDSWSLYVGYRNGRVWVKECSTVEPMQLTLWERMKMKLGW